MTRTRSPRLPLIGGVLAALGASLCCIGPLVLVLLGVGGAWVGSLARLEPFRPFFLAAAAAALYFAWRRLYSPAACTPGAVCASPRVSRLYKALFWLVALLVLFAFVFPYLAPLFY
ncbi:MAG: mercuric ion transporter MerT [Burkholderiales bacterium]|nr:mercuric ion transporter MerT [Burkholderiales bacterium]